MANSSDLPKYCVGAVTAEASDSPRERSAVLLRRISRALRDPQAEDWVTLDLSMAQLKLLFSLYYRGPATVGALAHVHGLKLPTVSTTLERLVRAGYVERTDDPDDRRVVINRLTANGGALVERLREERRLRIDQALDKLAPRDVATLHEGLSALAAALGLNRPNGSAAAPEVSTVESAR